MNNEKLIADPKNKNIICLRTDILRKPQVEAFFWSRVEELKKVGYSGEKKPQIMVNVVTSVKGTSPADHKGISYILCSDPRVTYAWNILNFDGTPRKRNVMKKVTVEKKTVIMKKVIVERKVTKSPNPRSGSASPGSYTSWADSPMEDQEMDFSTPPRFNDNDSETVAPVPQAPPPPIEEVVTEEVEVFDHEEIVTETTEVLDYVEDLPGLVPEFEWPLDPDQVNYYKTKSFEGEEPKTHAHVFVIPMQHTDMDWNTFSKCTLASYVLPDELTLEEIEMYVYSCTGLMADMKESMTHKFGDGTVVTAREPVMTMLQPKCYRQKRTLFVHFNDPIRAQIFYCMCRQFTIRQRKGDATVVLVNAYASIAGEEPSDKERRPRAQKPSENPDGWRSPACGRHLAPAGITASASGRHLTPTGVPAASSAPTPVLNKGHSAVPRRDASAPELYQSPAKPAVQKGGKPPGGKPPAGKPHGKKAPATNNARNRFDLLDD